MELSTKGKTIMAEKRLQGNKLSKAAGAVRRGAKALWPCAFLTALTCALMFLPVEEGCVFGSEGDWYSQHVGAAEALRQTMLRAGTLLPPYVGVGGGSSIYDLAYYGLLRPDLILSCLLPNVSMQHVISAYAALGVAASACLVYGWLRARDISVKGCLAGAVLFAAGTGFFHAHHQIIFVNYMPFLILALMGVDRLVSRKRGGLLAVSLCLVYLHSFFYAFACLAVCFLYYLYRCGGEGIKGLWLRRLPHGILAVVLSMAMAGALLLPTALDIFSNGKEIGAFAESGFSAVDLSLSGLLYQPYGCGLTLLSLFCLITAVQKRELRPLAVVLLAVMALPAAAYVLNGFLYARAKILIPFMPLIALVCARVMEELMEGRRRPQLWAAALCLVPAVFSNWRQLILLDGGILLLWAAAFHIKELPVCWRKRICASLLLVPLCVSAGVNWIAEDYLRADDDRQSHFSLGDITMFASDLRYRYDVLANNYVNSNLLADGSLNKTAMYSSIHNGSYNRFCYDTMKNPISLRNRVVIMPSVNSFFSYFMGIRYLVASADRLPPGYSAVFTRDGYALAENPNVRPMVYGSWDLLSEEDYDGLEPLQRMEALCSRTVAGGETTKRFYSHTVPMRDTAWLEAPLMEGTSGKVRLPEPLDDEILIVAFDVAYDGWKDLTVEIGGVKNCLSGRGAPYPNENRHFTFVIPAEKLESLELKLPELDFEISNLQVYTMDAGCLGDEDIAVPEMEEELDRAGGEVFAGELQMAEDGYLATSLPWRDGYEIYVDGQAVAPEKVNTAFLGAKLEAGTHQILIRYSPPGFAWGKALSLAGCLGVLVMVLGEMFWFRRKEKR